MRNIPVKYPFIILIFLCFIFLLIASLFCRSLHIDDYNKLILLLTFGTASGIAIALLYYFSGRIVNRNLKEIHKILYSIKVNGNGGNDSIHEATFIDIKEEIGEWAEERKREIEQLKNLERYRKEYLGDVSHELKTPIFNIQGYVLSLLDGGLDDPGINRPFLEKAEKNVERMINIVRDLEAISQLEAGELLMDLERFDIISMIREVFETMEIQATSKGIILSLANSSNESIYAIGDKHRIRQVLTNLFSNSIRYGKEYGETKVSVKEINGNLQIDIEDNGIGMSEEHLNRIFERFYRIDKSRSRDQGGTGLGLSIVKHIIEAHQQKIWVNSKVGTGTTFSFTLKR